MQNKIEKLIEWIGTTQSLLIHTIFFTVAVILMPIFGIERVLLFLTTAVSLEAIYLSIFIQMTVNRQHEHIEDISEDVDDILEDTEELTE